MSWPAYRRTLLGNVPRARGVLDLAAEKAGWGGTLPAGRGRGVAVIFGFGSYIAQVAEVTVAKDGQVRVDCAVDCGQIVNPDTVKAHMEGGIVFGLTAALYGTSPSRTAASSKRTSTPIRWCASTRRR